MKFLADENIDLSVVNGIKGIGIDIDSIDLLGKKGLDDKDILNFAKESNMVIITRDSDFLSLHSQGISHKGIIFIPTQLSIGEIVKEVEKVSLLFELADLENTVIFIPLM